MRLICGTTRQFRQRRLVLAYKSLFGEWRFSGGEPRDVCVIHRLHSANRCRFTGAQNIADHAPMQDNSGTYVVPIKENSQP